MKPLIDNAMQLYGGEEFLKLISPDHLIQLHQFIEEEIERYVFKDMLPDRDTEGYEMDYDHYLILNNMRRSDAFPNRQVFACVTVIYHWTNNGMGPRLEHRIEEVRVFDTLGDMDMFKFKEAVDDESPKPIFN